MWGRYSNRCIVYTRSKPKNLSLTHRSYSHVPRTTVGKHTCIHPLGRHRFRHWRTDDFYNLKGTSWHWQIVVSRWVSNLIPNKYHDNLKGTSWYWQIVVSHWVINLIPNKYHDSLKGTSWYWQIVVSRWGSNLIATHIMTIWKEHHDTDR